MASYTIDLDFNEPDCYYVRVPIETSVLSGHIECWEITDHHERGCRHFVAWIEKAPSNHEPKIEEGNKNVWSSNPGKFEEDFSVEVGGGVRYRLCMESSELTQDEVDDDKLDEIEIQVGFDLRVQTETRALPVEELGPDAIRAIGLMHAATGTERQIQNLLDHFVFIRNREAIHSQLTAQINSRVVGWTVIEAILVITMAIAQVWYWKTFFEQRRYL